MFFYSTTVFHEKNVPVNVTDMPVYNFSSSAVVRNSKAEITHQLKYFLWIYSLLRKEKWIACVCYKNTGQVRWVAKSDHLSHVILVLTSAS